MGGGIRALPLQRSVRAGVHLLLLEQGHAGAVHGVVLMKALQLDRLRVRLLLLLQMRRRLRASGIRIAVRALRGIVRLPIRVGVSDSDVAGGDVLLGGSGASRLRLRLRLRLLLRCTIFGRALSFLCNFLRFDNLGRCRWCWCWCWCWCWHWRFRHRSWHRHHHRNRRRIGARRRSSKGHGKGLLLLLRRRVRGLRLRLLRHPDRRCCLGGGHCAARVRRRYVRLSRPIKRER